MSDNENRIISGPDENGVRYYNLGNGQQGADENKTVQPSGQDARPKKNNKKIIRNIAIILAIVSFIVFAFYILNIVMYMANGRISYIIQFFSINPKGAIMLVRSDILNFFLPTAAMFLCGCVGIGFAKASRRIK